MSGDPYQYQYEEIPLYYNQSFLSIDVSGLRRVLYERNAMGWMVEGCLRPKAMIDSIVPLSIGTSWHTTETTPAL